MVRAEPVERPERLESRGDAPPFRAPRALPRARRTSPRMARAAAAHEEAGRPTGGSAARRGLHRAEGAGRPTGGDRPPDEVFVRHDGWGTVAVGVGAPGIRVIASCWGADATGRAPGVVVRRSGDRLMKNIRTDRSVCPSSTSGVTRPARSRRTHAAPDCSRSRRRRQPGAEAQPALARLAPGTQRQQQELGRSARGALVRVGRHGPRREGVRSVHVRTLTGAIAGRHHPQGWSRRADASAA